ncbi:MAG: hypothetical protein R3F14_02430 [Polyangiaceae bacterium]
MPRFRITFEDPADLLRAAGDEMRRGVLLVKVEPPADLEFRAAIEVEIASAAGSVVFASEVVSLLPTVGVAVSVPPDKLDEVRSLAADMPPGSGEARHELLRDGAQAAPAQGAAAESPSNAAQPARLSFGEKVQLALHGTKDDRATILRDSNKQLHPFVLRAPNVTPEEIAAWAANPQMSADFLKQIADRKEWISRPAIALALARNPRAPAEISVRAVEFVPAEHLRQLAKGVGALPHVVQAARRKILPK